MMSTVWGMGLEGYVAEPGLAEDERLVWREPAGADRRSGVLRGVAEPFQPTGGLKVMGGNIGRAVGRPPRSRRSAM